jgi:hypothetical protein
MGGTLIKKQLNLYKLCHEINHRLSRLRLAYAYVPDKNYLGINRDYIRINGINKYVKAYVIISDKKDIYHLCAGMGQEPLCYYGFYNLEDIIEFLKCLTKKQDNICFDPNCSVLESGKKAYSYIPFGYMHNYSDIF